MQTWQAEQVQLKDLLGKGKLTGQRQTRVKTKSQPSQGKQIQNRQKQNPDIQEHKSSPEKLGDKLTRNTVSAGPTAHDGTSNWQRQRKT